MEILWEDGSYAGELILCEGLVSQVRDEHIPQTNIETVYYYLDDSQSKGNKQKTHDDTMW